MGGLEAITELIEKEAERLQLEHERDMLMLRDELEQTGYGDMKWFKKQVDMSDVNKIKEKLYTFRPELEGAYVKYSTGQGDKWQFNKPKMLEWLKENSKRWWSEK